MVAAVNNYKIDDNYNISFDLLVGIPDHLDPDANGDGIPDCNRNKSVRYHVVRSFGGSIKKVIKVRQLTEEEDALSRLKEAVDHRLHRIRALMDPLEMQPTPTQFVKSTRAPIISHPSLGKKVLSSAAEAPSPAMKKKLIPPKKMKTEAKFVQKNKAEKFKVPTGQLGKRKLTGLYLGGDENGQGFLRDEDLDVETLEDEVCGAILIISGKVHHDLSI